jgi:hypothetical protein
MTRIAIIVALVTLATPALALGYDCSPYTGACVPRASPPSVFDDEPTYYAPRGVWPRTCPLDGPGAWNCGNRNRRDRRR